MEVHAPDGVGVLYRITRALADFDLDIRTAKVQTQGASVVDAFYVLDADGNRLTDPHAPRRGRAGRAPRARPSLTRPRR